MEGFPRRAMLDVKLLGRLRLAYDGKEIPFSARPKVAPLLAYLLLNRNERISRDELAFTLWPDESESTARANLRRHLHYLRKVLPPSRKPWVIADSRAVSWNAAASFQLDVTEFERLTAGDRDLETAVSVYGELLQGCEDEWLIAARERLRALYVQSLWELVRRARGRRDAAAANEYLGRILADDPWREDALRALMAVRYESGDGSSALQICAQFEARLTREMGAQLMPETAALRRAIERGNPLPAAPLNPLVTTELASPDGLPFEGRLPELDQLRELWQRAAAGSGTFALVVGEAGIGKTRLVSEFAVHAEAMGARVFWGTTSSPETAPYQAITEILRAGLGFLDLSNRERYDLEVLSGLLPEVQQQERSRERDGASGAGKLFTVVGDIFAELARPRPALFVLEDLHAAGTATAAMLQHIAQHCGNQAILIVATLREEEPVSAELLGRLRHPTFGAKPCMIPLGPLSDVAVGAIVERSLGRRTEAARIAARSGGHPLFLAQLVDAVKSQGLTTATLPMRLRESIDARTQRLSAPAGFVLRVASVVGSAFDLEIIAQTIGWSEKRLAAAADELIARRVVRQTLGARTFEYEFAHDLIASTAYESVPERERKRWHRRVGRAAERFYASRLSDLLAFVARHLDLGGEPDSAADYYLQAARRAESSFANDEALAYARRGIELKPRAPAR